MEKAIDLSIPKDSSMTRLYIGMTDCYKMAQMYKEQIASIKKRYQQYDKQNHKLLYTPVPQRMELSSDSEGEIKNVGQNSDLLSEALE